jgi:triosephosphate isomerase
VGETEAQREAGKTLAVVEEQLNTVLEHNRQLQMKEVVIAYEPVWAIGTGKTATATQAQEVHVFIRQQLQARKLASRILYGGSVNAENAQALFVRHCKPKVLQPFARPPHRKRFNFLYRLFIENG